MSSNAGVTGNLARRVKEGLKGCHAPDEYLGALEELVNLTLALAGERDDAITALKRIADKTWDLANGRDISDGFVGYGSAANYAGCVTAALSQRDLIPPA